MDDHDNELYAKYKLYGFNEDVTTLQFIKPIYNQRSNTIENKIQYFNHSKFEGFYLIRFHTSFLNELKEIMTFYGKDHTSLYTILFILHYHLYFRPSDYNGDHVYRKIIDEYCSVYDDFQKIKFIQRLPELTIYRPGPYENPITDIRLSKTEYKLLEKFLLKQLKFENIMKIERYPKRGFLRRI